MKVLIALIAIGALSTACGRDDHFGVDHNNLDLSPKLRSSSDANPHVTSGSLSKDDIKVSVSLSSDGQSYVFTNQSPESVFFNGYFANLPIYIYEGRANNVNTPNDWFSLAGWCGNDLKSFELGVNESIVIKIDPKQEFEKGLDAVRVSMYFFIDSVENGLKVIGPEIDRS